jgi:hypothetical protein
MEPRTQNAPADWNTPQITLSIITQSRALSLTRLLSSLNNSIYFGDTISLRITIDHSPSPAPTLHAIAAMRWLHGPTCVHRRAVKAGLMTAVVESWYPAGNDEYGVLLEDDVEVSRLWYAWAKMGVLRYRYSILLFPNPPLT